MKSHKIAVLVFSIFLTACNNMPQTPLAKNSEVAGLGIYKVNLERADARYASKDYPKALQEYNKLHQNFANDSHVLFRLGNIYYYLGRPKDAILAYEKALAIDKNMSKTWFNLGKVHMQQSAKTWQQMGKYVEHQDPLYKSSLHYSKGLSAILQPQGVK